MKKLVFAASLFAVSFFGAYAQDDSALKPTAGEVTGEFVLTNDFNLGLNNGLLRFRYFFADDMAARVGLGISRTSDREIVLGGNNEEGTIRTINGNITLNLGVEKHFSGTNRLSPYVGADLLFSLTSERTEGEDVDFGTGDYLAGATYEVRGTGNAGTGIGLRLVGGADFYIARHLFFGGEFGWGFLVNSNRDDVAEATVGGTTTSTTTPDGRSFSLNPSVVGGLRIGFVF